jgi:predicted anti-sigma-YlaC factor YlaD
MLNCRHVTRLVSQSMDAKLPWHQRVAVRIHLLYCVWCRRYVAQIRFLREAAKEMAVGATTNLAPKLSVEAKEQMRQRLHEALKTPPSSGE